MTYDVIFDVVGVTRFSGCIQSLNEKGIYLQGNGSISRGERSRAGSLGMSALSGPADYSKENLLQLKELIEMDKITTMIDRRYALEDIVEAHWYVEKGGKKGNVVISFS